MKILLMKLIHIISRLMSPINQCSRCSDTEYKPVYASLLWLDSDCTWKSMDGLYNVRQT